MSTEAIKYVCGVQVWSQGEYFPVSSYQRGDVGCTVYAPFTDRKLHINGVPSHPLTVAKLRYAMELFKFFETIADNAIESINSTGGFSSTLAGGFEVPDGGYIASVKRYEKIIPLKGGKAQYRDVFNYIFDHAKWINSVECADCPAQHKLIGGWVCDDNLYLDCSAWFADSYDCFEYAWRNDQLTYWDNTAKVAIPVGKFA
jgi:hypothetical protein